MLKGSGFRSTTLSKVEKYKGEMSIPDIIQSQTLTTEQTETILFDQIDDSSLLPCITCKKCGSIVTRASEKLLICPSCVGVVLFTSCVSKMILKLKSGSNTYTCDSDLLSKSLPSDLMIGQNEEFILYMLSNEFTIKHANDNISLITLTKDINE